MFQLSDFGLSYLDFAWRVRQLLFHVSASLSLDYICLCLLSYLCLECIYLCSVSQSLEFICLSLLSTAFGLCLHWALFHSAWTYGPRIVPQHLGRVCFAFQSLGMWLCTACHCPECLCLSPAWPQSCPGIPGLSPTLPCPVPPRFWSLPVCSKEGSDINWVAWHEVLHHSKICPRSATGKSNLCGHRERGPPNSQTAKHGHAQLVIFLIKIERGKNNQIL